MRLTYAIGDKVLFRHPRAGSETPSDTTESVGTLTHILTEASISGTKWTYYVESGHLWHVEEENLLGKVKIRQPRQKRVVVPGAQSNETNGKAPPFDELSSVSSNPLAAS